MTKRYTTRQIQNLFDWATPGQVTQTAKREGAVGQSWDRRVEQDNRRTRTYSAAAVDAYWEARRRTPLLRKLGWKADLPHEDGMSRRGRTKALCRSDEFDSVCPECGGFAVEFGGRVLCDEKDRSSE